MKKYHWHVFQHEKLFEKQSLLHFQTHYKFPPETCMLKIFSFIKKKRIKIVEKKRKTLNVLFNIL